MIKTTHRACRTHFSPGWRTFPGLLETSTRRSPCIRWGASSSSLSSTSPSSSSPWYWSSSSSSSLQQEELSRLQQNAMKEQGERSVLTPSRCCTWWWLWWGRWCWWWWWWCSLQAGAVQPRPHHHHHHHHGALQPRVYSRYHLNTPQWGRSRNSKQRWWLHQAGASSFFSYKLLTCQKGRKYADQIFS